MVSQTPKGLGGRRFSLLLEKSTEIIETVKFGIIWACDDEKYIGARLTMIVQYLSI